MPTDASVRLSSTILAHAPMQRRAHAGARASVAAGPRASARAGARFSPPACLLVLMTLAGCGRAAPGPFAFTPVQPSLFSAPGALVNAWADLDGDGDPDLFVGFNGQGNRLYRNDGGRFTDIAAGVGLADTLHTRSAAWGDFDGDGDPDLVLGFALPAAQPGPAAAGRGTRPGRRRP